MWFRERDTLEVRRLETLSDRGSERERETGVESIERGREGENEMHV